MKLLPKTLYLAGGLVALVILFGVTSAILFPSGSGERINLSVANGYVITAEVADTPAERGQGLSFRKSIGLNEGMLFVFNELGSHGFWMKDMRFPIDIIWIAGDRVVGVVENAAPEPEKSFEELPIYYPPQVVDKVLEIRSGRAGIIGIMEGTVIKVKE